MAKKPAVLTREEVEHHIMVLALKQSWTTDKSQRLACISLMTNSLWYEEDGKILIDISVNSKGRVVIMTYQLGHFESTESATNQQVGKAWNQIRNPMEVIIKFQLSFVKAKAEDGGDLPDIQLHSIQVYSSVKHFEDFWKNNMPLKLSDSTFTKYKYLEDDNTPFKNGLVRQATTNVAKAYGKITRTQNIKSHEAKMLDDLFGVHADKFAAVQADLLKRMPTVYDAEEALKEISFAVKKVLKAGA